MSQSEDTGSCCSSGSSATPAPASTPDADADAMREKVRDGYGAIARTGTWSSVSLPVVAESSSCCAPTASPVGDSASGGCCGPSTLTPDDVARAVGYAAADLASLPEGANMGLSCGNPTTLASLKAGETVLDLGAGGGFDCFIAGPRVGATGRVIGVDMTPDMLALARKNLGHYRGRSGLDNVEFRLGEIENLPAADASIDVVISNCVINLSPDKPRVWREIARVLKPGGRVAVSDLALLRPLPEGVLGDVEALVGCVAGAALVDDIRADAAAAGLSGIEIRVSPGYVQTFVNAEDPLYASILAKLPAGTSVGDFVTSAEIIAVR